MMRIKGILADKFFLRLCVFALIFFATIISANSQPTHFRNPLDIPIQLAANFGEIRTDHYHTGYDIRTNGKTGYEVYAAADGYVSRIKVSPYGFGNVLYILHPNGYMTVYGHLDRFNDSIAKYIKAQQYAQENYEVELFPPASKFPVKEGDLIAYSGNSGSSEGPHLHFEIRDSQGESYPVNPKDFLPIVDTVAPVFSSFYVYSLDSEDRSENVSVYKIGRKDTSFKSGLKIIPVSASRMGLAVEASDLINQSQGDNGIYQLSASLDGIDFFSMKFDRLDFSNGRYVNAHIDYEAEKKDKGTIQRLYVLPGDHNSIYSSLQNNGIIELKDTFLHIVQIKAVDDNNNKSQLKFMVKLKPSTAKKAATKLSGTHFYFDRSNSFSRDSIKLAIPANALYQNMDFKYSSERTGTANYYSAIYHLHNPYTPIHTSCDLYMLPRKIPEALKSKAVIVYRNENGGISAKTSGWEGKFLTTKIRNFGDYSVMLDTSAPKILPVNTKQNQLISGNEIAFKVTDNLSGITKYNAYLDDQWVLMEYDAKNNLMTCMLEDSLATGDHTLKIVVSDEVKNESTYSLTFKK